MDKKQEQLEKEIKKLTSEVNSQEQVVRDTQRHLDTTRNKLKNLQNQLASLQTVPKKLIVSDHVILRYAERHYNFPVEKIRQEIADKLQGAEKLGSLKAHGFVVRGHTVVTYVPTTEDLANKRMIEKADG